MIFPETINLNDFILCKPSLEFANQISKLALNNQDEFSFIPWARDLTTIVKAEENLKTMLEKWEKNGFTYFLFKGDKLMGYAGVHVRLREHVAELSYYLDKKYTGKGYITRAIATLEKIFFEQKGHRCEIFCNETNKKSCAVAERLNYHLDGTMREYELIDGVFRGVRVYSKLSTD